MKILEMVIKKNLKSNKNNKMKEIENVIIIGSGPAGMSAALYCARANLKPLLFEGTLDYGLYPGGQLTTTSTVENYLGLDAIGGYNLTEEFRKHAEKYGLRIISQTVVKITSFLEEGKEKKIFRVYSKESPADDSPLLTYLTRSVIIATGANAKRLGMKGEEEFWHHGISSCATCDGSLPIFRKKPIVVVGGGNTAIEQSLYLSKFASHVYIVHRRDKFRAEKIMIDRVLSNHKISIIYNSVVEEALQKEEGKKKEKKLTHLRIKNVQTGEETLLEANGLFYGIGHTPNTSFLKKRKGEEMGDNKEKEIEIEMDEEGYIVVHDNVFTSVDGIYACGDVSDKKYRQAITSAGTGCMAALESIQYLL